MLEIRRSVVVTASKEDMMKNGDGDLSNGNIDEKVAASEASSSSATVLAREVVAHWRTVDMDVDTEWRSPRLVVDLHSVEHAKPLAELSDLTGRCCSRQK